MIALTGASGFIGSYISDKLPYPQKRLSRQVRNNPPHSNYKWMTGDLSNNAVINELVKDSPTLIHLACTSYPRSSNLNMEQDIQSNLVTTIKLFETFAKSNPGGHIIFSSSGGNMYDGIPNSILRTEKDYPRPQSSYGIHKLAAENYLRLFCEIYGVKATILRITNPYGILLPKQRVQGLIGVAFAKLLAKEHIRLFDSLESVRDYIHLDDVAKAFELAIELPPKPKECRTLNVSSGEGHTLLEVLGLIEETTGLSFVKQFETEHLPAPTYSVLSYQKIKETLKWTPQLNLKQGIQSMWHEFMDVKNAY